jgi:predicted nucleotidyltransferase
MDYLAVKANLDIKAEDWLIVNRILAKLVPNYDVWAFGSRVNGRAKPFSDLDIAILSDKPLSLYDYATLKDAFEDSDLPYRVDIIDWAAASLSFKMVIQKNKQVIQLKKSL